MAVMVAPGVGEAGTEVGSAVADAAAGVAVGVAVVEGDGVDVSVGVKVTSSQMMPPGDPLVLLTRLVLIRAAAAGDWTPFSAERW